MTKLINLAYRNHLLDVSKNRINQVLREFNPVALTHMDCNIEEITDIINGLEYARDIIKELKRSLE
jgi:glutathionyl-hydroquinone reductase